VTLVLMFFNLVFGELVPKRIALQKAEAFSMLTVMPIHYISIILSPFIKLLSVSTKLVLRILHMKTEDQEEAVTEEDIKALPIWVTLVLMFFNLVFGELVPKRIALQKAEAFSMLTVMPIHYISIILSPFIKLLSVSTKLVLRILHMKTEDQEEAVTEEEIKAL